MRKEAIVYLLLAAGLAAPVHGGQLDAPSGPGSYPTYTLQDLYNRLNDGTAGSPSTFTEPSTGPADSARKNLNQIMDAAPEVDDTNGATAADVADGKTFWGLTSGEWGLRTGTATSGSGYPAPVPNGFWRSGTKTDGPRFTDNNDGTVTDNLTGLIWLKKANCANTSRPWATALSDVVQLNTDGTMNGNDCGDTSNGGVQQTDWRLPHWEELISLIEYGRYNPALPADHTFTGVQWEDYWSSTSFAYRADAAWHVHLGNGSVNVDLKTYYSYVWPVRGGE